MSPWFFVLWKHYNILCSWFSTLWFLSNTFAPIKIYLTLVPCKQIRDLKFKINIYSDITLSNNNNERLIKTILFFIVFLYSLYIIHYKNKSFPLNIRFFSPNFLLAFFSRYFSRIPLRYSAVKKTTPIINWHLTFDLV